MKSGWNLSSTSKSFSDCFETSPELNDDLATDADEAADDEDDEDDELIDEDDEPIDEDDSMASWEAWDGVGSINGPSIGSLVVWGGDVWTGGRDGGGGGGGGGGAGAGLAGGGGGASSWPSAMTELINVHPTGGKNEKKTYNNLYFFCTCNIKCYSTFWL